MTPSQSAPRGDNEPGRSPDIERPQNDHSEAREHHLDKTIADSFPASDPPSTDPNPDGDD